MTTNRSHPYVIALIGAALAVAFMAPAHEDLRAQTAKPGTADSITETTLRAHLEFLASDAMNGRASNSRDEWIAATYIASQFRLWDLEPMGDNGGYVQAAEILRETAAAPAVLSAGTSRFTHGKDMLVTILTGAKISGPLVKFKQGATSVPPGSVVLMPDWPDAQLSAATRATGGAAAPTAGAAIIIIKTTQTPEQWTANAARPLSAGSRFTKVTPAPGAPVRTARVALSPQAYDAMAALSEGTSISLDTEVTATKAYTWNAVGRLSGTDPKAKEEVIVLGAHLDHVGMRENAQGSDKIYNGADDDGSGTVAVMALAQALAAGPRPKRTLVFALFGSEEGGGAVSGSSYFVDLPVVPLDRIVAQIQFEMLARPDPMVPARSLWLTGFERSNLGSELSKHGARLVQDPRPEQSFFTRSDNIKFARKGVVSHTVSSFNLHKDYHQASDEIDKVNFAHMVDAVRSMLGPIRWIANSMFVPAWTAEGRPR
jgi:aminopeptidase YwaD